MDTHYQLQRLFVFEASASFTWMADDNGDLWTVQQKRSGGPGNRDSEIFGFCLDGDWQTSQVTERSSRFSDSKPLVQSTDGVWWM